MEKRQMKERKRKSPFGHWGPKMPKAIFLDFSVTLLNQFV